MKCLLPEHQKSPWPCVGEGHNWSAITETDEFYDWVAKTKFNEFATTKERYEDDLDRYIEKNLEQLEKEYLKNLM